MGRRGRFDNAADRAAPIMRGDQFDAIATLIRSRGPTRAAARLVFVEGVRQRDAALRLGISGQNLSNTLTAFQKAALLVQTAAAAPPPDQPPLWFMGAMPSGEP